MTDVRLADFVKAYDVRGLVPTQLNPRVAQALGSAFAQVVAQPDGDRGVVIGHDMRESSPELARAFAAGVAGHGLDVTMIGLCSTDGLYYASGSLDLPGAMFTASHNPAQYNGIKLCRRGARPVSQDSGLAEIRDLAQWTLDRAEVHGVVPSGRPGNVTETDLLAPYAAYLHSLVDLSAIRPLRVVVDAGNGMAGLTVPEVLGLDGLPLDVVALYFELDGTFPHHEANPLDPENLRDLQRAVREHHADLGLAFDGDADRCFVVDERGEPVSPSAITALVAAREISRAVAAGQDPGDVAVVHNVICSRVVPETIAELGARAVRTRVGHSFIKAHMAEHEAVFGGEHSAHYYFRDFWYADTGMLAALHVLAALGEQEGPLSQLVARYDRYAASGELNSRVTDVAGATARVRDWALAQGATEDALDGLTMTHEADPLWWFSLRPSNTEPLLRLNVEAKDAATMEQVRDAVLDLVRQEA
ncbi:phosphomannomutase/phosphoglucomutase [Ornithinimicrobium flavum]|uniref:phosphomannomutase/phosphoglucomutase n=1 Tax=Ornithinimicrobium flavum TaxID=1288636 RepID=UPI00106FC40D|nr:phosphomannomutase/phosphoglucomutase [Ornithinimicrobium flavum]